MFVTTLLIFTSVISAQTTSEHNKRTELSKGASVTIEGCVAGGERQGTFVLGTVKEVLAVNVETLRKRVYWLDSTYHIKNHVGHKVRIEGTVTDLERSEIEIDRAAGAKGVAVAKIEGPGGIDVTAPAAKVAGLPADTPASADIPTELVKIKVKKSTRLAGVCG